jgi:hypothetical protein
MFGVRKRRCLLSIHPLSVVVARPKKIENISFFFFIKTKNWTRQNQITSPFLMDWKVLFACRGVVDSKEIKNRNPNNIWKTKKPKSNGSE